MEEITEKIEPDKTTTWGIRLRDSEKLKLNDMLDSLGGDKKETLLDIVSKAVVAQQSQKATTGLIAELETYTKAIMQAALRQASAAAAVETATKAKYDELLDIEHDEKVKLTEQIDTLKKEIDTLKAAIKAQKEQISAAADKVEKQREEIYCLKNDLETAQRNAEAVAEIQNEYSSRLKAAEVAKAAAEKAADDAQAAQAAADKECDRLRLAAASDTAKVQSQADQITDLKAQLATAQAQSAQLLNLLATAQQQPQPQHAKKAAAKAKTEAHTENFEEEVEERGQQKLIEE